MGATTKESPKEVLAKASAFFGPNGVGLNIIPRGENVLEFTGGGGFVRVEAKTTEAGTEIDVQSQEWNYDVKRFLSQL
jgi:hypothetical protein